MITKIKCIYCDEQSAIEIIQKGGNSSSSDGWHYFKCFNSECGKFFTEIMRSSPKEQWEKLLEQSNLCNNADTRECPYCCENKAFNVNYPANFDFYICECGNEFPSHDIRNIEEDRKIKQSDTASLISMVEEEFREVNEEFRKYGRQLNKNLNTTLILKVLHERLKRIESK